MTTPRKYPTLAEFEDLKEAVARIEARLSSKPERSSVIVDAVEACERIGIVDAYGTPVAVGDEIGRWRAAPAARFARSSCARRPDPARPPCTPRARTGAPSPPWTCACRATW